LGRVEVELVQCEGDLLGVELAGTLARIEERADFEQVEDSRRDGGLRRAARISCAQNCPLRSIEST
jgi:hypothetical protein